MSLRLRLLIIAVLALTGWVIMYGLAWLAFTMTRGG